MERILKKFEKMNLNKCSFNKYKLCHKENKSIYMYKLKNDMNHIKSRIKKLELTLFFLRQTAHQNQINIMRFKKIKKY